MKGFRYTILLLLVLSACSESAEIPTPTYVFCPGDEDLSANPNPLNKTVGLRVAQYVNVSGTVGSTYHLNAVTIYMSSNNLTQVSVKVYQNPTSGADSGTLLATVNKTTGLGSSSSTGPLTFTFSSPVPFVTGGTYSLVISGTGGAYTISKSTAQTLNNFLYEETSTNNWSSISGSLNLIADWGNCN